MGGTELGTVTDAGAGKMEGQKEPEAACHKGC